MDKAFTAVRRDKESGKSSRAGVEAAWKARFSVRAGNQREGRACARIERTEDDRIWLVGHLGGGELAGGGRDGRRRRDGEEREARRG